MLHRDLQKHAREFAGYLANGQFDVTDDGILFPRAHAIACGWYEHDVNGQDVRWDKNLLPTEGLNHMLDVVLHASTQITTWYLALYSGAVTPSSSWTASNFTTSGTEITSGTEGYEETTRVEFNEAAAASGATTNSANKAAFTIITASTLTVNGCGLLSASAKGSTSGKLLSASRFGAARTLNDDDVFNLGYTVSLTSS